MEGNKLKEKTEEAEDESKEVPKVELRRCHCRWTKPEPDLEKFL